MKVELKDYVSVCIMFFECFLLFYYVNFCVPK